MPPKAWGRPWRRAARHLHVDLCPGSPPRAARYDGALRLGGLPHQVNAAAIRAAFGTFGEIVSCEVDADDDDADEPVGGFSNIGRRMLPETLPLVTSLLKVAAGFHQCLLAVHHAGACFVA